MPALGDGGGFGAGGGTDVADAIDRLTPKQRGKGRLGPAPSREALPPSSAEALPPEPAAGGISWPLNEVADARTYGLPLEFTSSDGMFVWVVQPVAATEFVDADGSGGPVNFDEQV